MTQEKMITLLIEIGFRIYDVDGGTVFMRRDLPYRDQTIICKLKVDYTGHVQPAPW